MTNLYTLLRTTGNSSATSNLHTSKLTTAAAKPFRACCVFISLSLATASNSGESSASRPQVFLSQPPVQNSCQLSALLSLPCRAQTNCQPSTYSMPSLLSSLLLPILNLLSIISQLLTQLAGGLRYIASGQTQQKIPFPTIPLL
jgi:hypothetical protein